MKEKKFHSELERKIEQELASLPTVRIEKEPPMLNRSSYIFRPDFTIETTDNMYIIELKTKIGPNDVAMVSGTYAGLPAQPIIISQDEPDSNTTNLAGRLNIMLISGAPSDAVKRIKQLLEPHEVENDR